MAGYQDDLKFQIAVEQTLKDEGGDKLTDDPDDPGGRTKYGISQRFLDSVEPGRLVDNLLEADAKTIYYVHFWKEYKIDVVSEIDERIGKKLFNFLVTAGPDTAFRCLQRALRACGGDVKEDGVLGPATRGAMMNMLTTADARLFAFALLCSFKSEIAGYYRDLDKPKYEAGWVNRAYRG